jgi:MFS family permease
MLALATFPVIALVMLARRKRPLPRPERVPRERHAGVFDLLRLPALRYTLIASGLLNMGWDIYGFLMPLYGSRIGLTAGTIGVVMSTFALATFVVRAALTMLVRRVHHWTLISSAMALAALAYVLFPFVHSVPLLMALSFVLGLGLGASQPVIMALLYEASPRGRQGEAVGIRTTMMNGSQTFIPLASGAISATLGMAPVFALIAALLFGGAWFARQRIK